MEDLGDVPAGGFTVEAGLSAGLSRRTLRSRRFSAPHRGVRVAATEPATERAAVTVARLVLPDATLATSVTGLRLFGVDIGSAEPMRFVTIHPRQVRRPGIRVTRVSELPEAWDELTAVPAYCWMTAALELNLLDLVIAGDWLLRERVVNRQPLIDYVTASRARGAAAARPALELIRERVDSPRESWLRMCLVWAGLPTPDCNPTIRCPGALGKVDLVYREFRVLIEYEGDRHRVDKTQWNLDIERHEAFTADGWTVHRVTAARAKRPRELVQRIHALLVAGGYRGPAPDFGVLWRTHFE